MHSYQTPKDHLLKYRNNYYHDFYNAQNSEQTFKVFCGNYNIVYL